MESVEIKFGKESSIFDNWIDDLPLKVITHGWFASDNFGQGVFEIRKRMKLLNFLEQFFIISCTN